MNTVIEIGLILGMALVLAVVVEVMIVCTSISAERDKWIPVGECMPEDGQDVLTYWPARGCIQLQTFYEAYANMGAWWMHGWQNLAVEDGDVTHWQPLPAPPGR